MLLKTSVFNWGVHQHLPHLARILVTSLAFFFMAEMRISSLAKKMKRRQKKMTKSAQIPSMCN